jgi:hypothetical protein
MVDPNLVTELVAFIDYWKFDPVRRADGTPFERTVLLPIEIVTE